MRAGARAAAVPERPGIGHICAMSSTVRADAALLERDRELAELEEIVGAVAGPGTRMALIEGPPGIGKTTLLAEVRRDASERGLRVLHARCSELEREFPFGVVRQLFEPELVDPAARAGALAGAAGTAAPLFGTLLEDAGATGQEDTGFAALHGLYWLTLNLAGEQPLLLSIDDLHWIDRASLRFLAYLVRRLEDVPAVVVSTLRPNEPGADEALIGEIAHDPLTCVIGPGPLSPVAVAGLIAERLGAAPANSFAGACHASTGGNPLLVQELLRALQAERVAPTGANVGAVRELGPRAVSRAVLLRLSRLSSAAARVARAMAVLGDGAELREIGDLSGLAARAVAEATGALARAEIVRPDRPLGFVHPLVRDAVYFELPPGERELEHQRAAELLHESGAKAELVAAHLLNTPRGFAPWVADVLERAGREAARAGAADSAVALLRRALDEELEPARRTRLLAELGHAELHVQGVEGADHLRQAYEATDDPRARARLAFSLAWTLMFTGRPPEGYAVARRAQDELPAELDDERAALVAIEKMSVIFGGGPAEDLAGLERHRALPAGAGLGARMLAACAAYHWSVAGGSAAECAPLARDALEGGTLTEGDNGLFWVAANAVLVYADDPYAMDVWETALRRAHSSGSLFGVLTVNLWRGWTLMRHGELAEAEASVRTGREQQKLWSTGSQTVGEYSAAFLAEVLVERGDLAAAREALDAERDCADVVGEGANHWRGARARLLLAEGRTEEALAAGDAYRERLAPDVNPCAHPWRSLYAEILDALGRTGEATELAEEEVRRARHWGAASTIGRALRVLGTLRRAGGIDDLRDAVELLARSPARLELAKAQCALGTALRLHRRPSDAREPLRQALALAESLDAVGLAERARAELLATGARPRSSAVGGVAALTPSERRVANLAASGMSNRDIAQELFVTPKTVEVHLSNAYRKLDIAGRRELAAVLA